MATEWLPPVDLTASGRPVFLPGEVERCILPAVDLEPGENPCLSPLSNGLFVLTSHRLLWIDETSAASFAIPLATVVHAYPAKKSIRSMFVSPRIGLQVSMSPEGRISDRGTRSEMIAVVMRGRSDPDAFYSRLMEALRTRQWEITVAEGRRDVDSWSAEPAAAAASSSEAAARMRMPVVGVSGILRKEQELWESTDKNLQEAFQDLNALMSKAKEMVQLAEKMRLKLLSGSNALGNSRDEDIGSKQDVQDWLLSVGIASPVTKESAGALYHQQLSRQLADFVKLPLEKAGGMIALIDVYCLFNRARGTALISPDDLLQACTLWENFDVPVMLRKFDSGVMVIQSKAQRDEEFFSRIASLAQKTDALRTGISPTDASLTLGIAPALAKEHLLTAENQGLLSRDVSPDGLRFFINLFSEIDPSDMYSIKHSGPASVWFSATSLPGFIE